jgi:hypothetical protein
MPMTVKVAGVLGEIDADHAVTEPGPGSLICRSAFTLGPYSIIESSTTRYTSQVGLAHFPPGLLPDGEKFLALYSCSFGLNNTEGATTTSATAQLIQNGSGGDDREFGYARAQGHMHPTALPAHMRAGNLSGFSLFTSNGNTVQFGLRNVQGSGGGTDHTAFFGGMNLVAIRMDSLVEGVDYWTSVLTPTIDEDTEHVPIELTGTGGNYFDIDQGLMAGLPVPSGTGKVTFTVSENGLYLVLATMGGGSSSSLSTVRAILDYTVNGSGVAGPAPQELRIQSSSERKNFLFQEIRGLQAGTVVDFTLRGELHGATVKNYYQPRVIVLRLNAFNSYAYDVNALINQPVTGLYPTFQEVARVDFTPSQAEHALVLGQAHLYRTNQGSQVARITDEWDGTRIHDFCAYGNLSGVDADRNPIWCFGAPLVHFPHTYSFEVAGEPGLSPGPTYAYPRLIVIGLTKAPASTPGMTTVAIDDAAPPGSFGSEDTLTVQITGGNPQLFADINDAPPVGFEGSSDQLTMTVNPAEPFVIPTAHPRMWLLPSRLQYLRSRVGEAEWNHWQANTSSASQNAWHRVLKWKMTQSGSDLTVAINAYFGTGGVLDRSLSTLIFDVEFRNYMRCMSLGYDWFYTDAGVDVLTPSQRAILKNAILCCLYGKLNPTGSGLPGALPSSAGATDNWATSNIYNNHFFAMMLGATVAGLALHYEAYPTFTWKAGNALTWTASDATTFEFKLPFDNGGDEDVTPLGGEIVFYGNIFNWVKARVEIMMLPRYDVDFAGGWTDEGTNYGRQPSVNCMLEMASLLRFSAGLDYLNTHQFFIDHGYFHIHAQPPGNKLLVNLGDQPISNKALLSDTDRLMALLIADAATGFPIAEHQQHWMNTYYPTASMSSSDYRQWNFLLYRHDRQAIDYTTQIPAYYIARGTGLWASRSSWATDALCVYMTGSYRHEEKHHSDFGAIQVYMGPPPADPADGWMILDATTWGGNKDDWGSHYHSGITVATAALPAGWPQQRFRDLPGAPPPGGTDPPPAPTLSSPANGATNVAVPVVLSWASAAGATSYAVQVSTDVTFATFVYNTPGITTTTTSVPGLAASTSYYWRVSATNSEGTSPYSSIRTFQTISTAPPPVQGVVLNSSTTATQLCPPDNWWNLDVSAAPLASNNSTIIANLMTLNGGGSDQTGSRLGTWHPDWGQNPIGIPYIGVDGTQPLVPVTFTQYPSESDNGQPGKPAGYPMPNELKTQTGWMENGAPASSTSTSGDRHALVWDRDNNYLYEIYKCKWTGSRWEGSNGACFQLNTNNRRPEGWTSTDAAGLGVFMGLVKYDEVHGSGPITHATRCSIRYSDGLYVYPASHWSADDVPSNSSWGYPMGMRFRLKASFNIPSFVANSAYGLSSANQAALTKLLTAWKKYGLIVADRGGNGFVQGTMDSRWVSGEFNKAIHDMHFTDFEVIQFGWDG